MVGGRLAGWQAGRLVQEVVRKAKATSQSPSAPTGFQSLPLYLRTVLYRTRQWQTRPIQSSPVPSSTVQHITVNCSGGHWWHPSAVRRPASSPSMLRV